MKLNRWFLLWYSLLVAALLLLIRFYFFGQLQNLARITANVHLEQGLEEQVENAQDQQIKQKAGQLLAQYRQIDLVNRISIRRSLLLLDSIFLLLFVTMILLFALGMYIISLPLKRILRFSSEIAAGNWEAVETHFGRAGRPTTLEQAFQVLVANLKQSQMRLAAAEKERTWRHIAQVMAHEIKNPLTPVRLAVEMIEEELPQLPDKPRVDFAGSLQTIKEELGRLETLVTTFRDFAKIPELDLSMEELAELIEDAAVPFKDKLALHLSTPRRPSAVPVDRLKFQQLLLNLFKNSMEAKARNIWIHLEIHKMRCCLDLRDDGSGFSPEALANVFVPYSSTKQGGTGLGLSVAKNIVEAHGGEIRAANHRQGGAWISIALPIQEREDHG